MILSLLLSLAGPALADEASCRSCCAASGAGACEPRLRVVGEQSIVVSRVAGDFEVVGLWVLPCEGEGFFDVGEAARFAEAPRVGQVATVDAPPAALRCFLETCALPRGLCPVSAGGAPALSPCAGGSTTDAALAAPTGAAPGGAGVETVIVGGKAVVVTRVAPPAPGAVVQPAVAQPAVARPAVAQPAVAQPAVAQPAALLPPAPPAAPAAAPAAAVADFSLPSPPKGSCATPAALIAESRRHVDLGNEAEIAVEVAKAADEYRAAITMDACNAYAWASLGSLALRQGHPEVAARALSVAVKLKPEHYGAATDLGVAYERLGRLDDAARAYRAALEARPGHPPAQAALKRLGAG